MIDPNADPDQLDLEDLLACRQGSFIFRSTSPSATIEMQVTPEEETDVNQLPLPLIDASEGLNLPGAKNKITIGVVRASLDLLAGARVLDASGLIRFDLEMRDALLGNVIKHAVSLIALPLETRTSPTLNSRSLRLAIGGTAKALTASRS